MTDKLSASRRSENMRRIRSEDTAPELVVRKTLYSLGYRYRLHCKDLPGKPDIVFKGRRKAIFVHGCFWHQHPGCSEAHTPKTNTSYWLPKLARNVKRDKEAEEALAAAGWKTLVIWECETSDAVSLARRLGRFMRA